MFQMKKVLVGVAVMAGLSASVGFAVYASNTAAEAARGSSSTAIASDAVISSSTIDTSSVTATVSSSATSPSKVTVSPNSKAPTSSKQEVSKVENNASSSQDLGLPTSTVTVGEITGTQTWSVSSKAPSAPPQSQPTFNVPTK